MRIGIDVGGTHTDAVVLDRQSVVASTKVLTSANVRDGVVNALDDVLEQSGVAHDQVEALAESVPVGLATRRLVELAATHGLTLGAGLCGI